MCVLPLRRRRICVITNGAAPYRLIQCRNMGAGVFLCVCFAGWINSRVRGVIGAGLFILLCYQQNLLRLMRVCVVVVGGGGWLLNFGRHAGCIFFGGLVIYIQAVRRRCECWFGGKGGGEHGEFRVLIYTR